MLYDKKVQFNLNSDFHYEPQADAASDTTDNNSIFITNCVQDAQNTDSMYDISNSEYIDGDIKESVDNSANSLSQTHGSQDYSENVLLIKQLEAEIAKMESEYQADQKGEGIAGAASSFFSKCWNGIKGNGFKDEAKVELDKKITLLEAAKSDPSKLAEAYEAIMGVELTHEVRQSTVQAQEIANNLSIEDKEQIVALLNEQANSLSQLMQETEDNQGWFSTVMDKLNNVLGFGTNSIKADAKIEDFIKQINSLDPHDPDFASKYQTLTGETLSLEGLNELFQGVSKVGNSTASEAIMDYEETQSSMKEIGCGVTVGLATAAAVIAAPFTGGTSLGAVALTVGFGATVGGTATVAINATDIIGTNKQYSFEQGLLDFGGGAINGAVTAMTLGGAGLAGKGLSVLKGTGRGVAMSQAKRITTEGLKSVVENAFSGFGKATMRSVGIAAFSSASNYILNTVGTNAIYDATGNYKKSQTPVNITQNDDGTYSICYELKDSTTGEVISYEIETVDTLSQDEDGGLIKGNILETSRSNDFNFGDLAKQTAVSIGTAAVGTGIGKLTGNVINPYATTLTKSVGLGNMVEIGADATLSIGADYLIASAQAGEWVDKDEFFSWDRILGECQNQIRGLLIGIASSKLEASKIVGETSAAEGLDTGTNTENILTAEPQGDTDITKQVAQDLLTIKLDGTDLPKTQQEVLEVSARLILKENDKTKASELLSSYGMSEAEISAFIAEATKVAEETNLTDVLPIKTENIEVTSNNQVPVINPNENNGVIAKGQSYEFDPNDDFEIELASGISLRFDNPTLQNRLASMENGETINIGSVQGDADILIGSSSDGISQEHIEIAKINDKFIIKNNSDTETRVTNAGVTTQITAEAQFETDVYTKIVSQLEAVTVEDVDKIVDDMKAKYPNISDTDIIYAMQKLTQFSSYSCLDEFAQQLNSLGVGGFYENSGLTLNSALYYVAGKKGGMSFNYYNQAAAFILDETGVKYLQDLKTSNPSAYQNLIDNPDIKFINLEGWDLGVNMYNIDHNLANVTDAFIAQAQNYLNDPSKNVSDLIEAVDLVLTESKTQNLGSIAADLDGKIETLSVIDYAKMNFDSEDIVRQMAPLAPTQKEVIASIDAAVEIIINRSDYPNLSDAEFAAKQDSAKSLLIKYFNDQIDIYSPQRLSTKLKEIYSNIEAVVGTNNMNNIYYLVPTRGKSFEQILLQYAEVNGIDTSKVIYKNSNGDFDVPDGVTVVILDDVVGSAQTMLYQEFGYSSFIYNYPNSSVLFAPIISASNGFENINDEITNHQRVHMDQLLYQKDDTLKVYKESDFYKSLSHEERNLLDKLLGDGCAFQDSYLATVFPYMGPDNDSYLSSILTKFFVPNERMLKSGITTEIIPILVKANQLVNNWK